MTLIAEGMPLSHISKPRPGAGEPRTAQRFGGKRRGARGGGPNSGCDRRTCRTTHTRSAYRLHISVATTGC